MPAAARYLRTLLLSTVVLLGAVATFDLSVDPYGLFNIVDRDGFNRIKSQAGQRAEVYKRNGAERMRPNALILGNSRAEIGFDPASPAWPVARRPVFNLALPGGGVDSALDELRHALTFTTPKLVVVGLDFLDFRVDATASGEHRPAPTDPLRWWRERLSALFSLNALADSLATLRAQQDPYATGLDAAGFNPMRDYAGIARREGYHAMFRQRDRENAKSYARGAKNIYFADGRPAPEFRSVEEFIDIARSTGMELIFVIYPVHAHTLVLVEKSGLWPAFEEWKRELTQRVARAPAGANVELWDFSGFSRYAIEAVPPAGDIKLEMRWYWEAGHFKSALGDAMLTNIFNLGAVQQDWGRRLTVGNVDEHLQT